MSIQILYSSLENIDIILVPFCFIKYTLRYVI